MVSTAFVLGVDHAAIALGVSRETLVSRLEANQVPEASKRHGSWMIPTEALPTIANREGWPLGDGTGYITSALVEIPEADHLTATPVSTPTSVPTCVPTWDADPHPRGDRPSTSSVLSLDRRQTEATQLAHELSMAEHNLALAERDRSIAEARIEELRRQVEQDRQERAAQLSRIRALEADREHAMQAMSRISRRRYLKLRQEARTVPVHPPTPTPQFNQTPAPTDSHPIAVPLGGA